MSSILSTISTSTNKLTAAAAGTSTGAGLAQILDIIPDNIGKLSAAVGVLLAMALLIKVTMEITLLIRKLQSRGESKNED